MRRTMFVALVLALILAAALPAGAKEVYNASQSFEQMQGFWSNYDEATGAWQEGGVYATEQGSETWIEYYGYTSTPAFCEGDVPGYYYEWFSAFGPGSMSTGKSYTSGSAAGAVEGWMESWTECWDGDVYIYEPGVSDAVSFEIGMEFTGTSVLMREKGSSSFKIPGEWNSHDTYSSVFRTGELLVSVDGDTFNTEGVLGKVSWKSHYNTK